MDEASVCNAKADQIDEFSAMIFYHLSKPTQA
jgi:hypothetical protein